MKIKTDLLAEFPGVVIIHQKIPSYEVGRHVHPEHEFFMPLQGEISVSYGNEVVKAGPGKMLYIPPDLDHSFSSSTQGSGERVICLIHKKTWNQHVNTPFSPSSFPINSLAKELVFYLLIHQEVQGLRYFLAALIESLGESLKSAQLEKLYVFSDHIAGKISDPRIQKAIQRIDEEMTSIVLTKLATQSGLSLRNLNRLFLKECGMTPKDFLILRRVERAKKLLKETQTTVTDISLEVGYNSLSKFITTFKKITGTLPSDFRKSLSL